MQAPPKTAGDIAEDAVERGEKEPAANGTPDYSGLIPLPAPAATVTVSRISDAVLKPLASPAVTQACARAGKVPMPSIVPGAAPASGDVVALVMEDALQMATNTAKTRSGLWVREVDDVVVFGHNGGDVGGDKGKASGCFQYAREDDDSVRLVKGSLVLVPGPAANWSTVLPKTGDEALLQGGVSRRAIRLLAWWIANMNRHAGLAGEDDVLKMDVDDDSTAGDEVVAAYEPLCKQYNKDAARHRIGKRASTHDDDDGDGDDAHAHASRANAGAADSGDEKRVPVTKKRGAKSTMPTGQSKKRKAKRGSDDEDEDGENSDGDDHDHDDDDDDDDGVLDRARKLSRVTLASLTDFGTVGTKDRLRHSSVGEVFDVWPATVYNPELERRIGDSEELCAEYRKLASAALVSRMDMLASVLRSKRWRNKSLACKLVVRDGAGNVIPDAQLLKEALLAKAAAGARSKVHSKGLSAPANKLSSLAAVATGKNSHDFEYVEEDDVEEDEEDARRAHKKPTKSHHRHGKVSHRAGR